MCESSRPRVTGGDSLRSHYVYGFRFRRRGGVTNPRGQRSHELARCGAFKHGADLIDFGRLFGGGLETTAPFWGMVVTRPSAASWRSTSQMVVRDTPVRSMSSRCLYLASDESSFVTGTELVIDGGYLAQ